MPETALDNPESAKETLASHVYDRLRQDIISVAIEPGQERERSPKWEVAHRNFHSSLISASGSRRLEQYCEHLFDSSERYRHVGRKAGIKGENREKEHRALMEAVVARDADAAARVITAHFERTAELVRQVLRNRAR